jgi:hypothetical protein
MVLVFSLVSLAFLLMSLMSAMITSTRYSGALPLSGTVTGSQRWLDPRIQGGGSPKFVMAFEATLPDGRTLKGRGHWVSYSQDWAPGPTIQLLYLPDNPDEPLVEFRSKPRRFLSSIVFFVLALSFAICGLTGLVDSRNHAQLPSPSHSATLSR